MVNLENENEGYSKSVKGILDYAKTNSKVHGTIANIISEVLDEYTIQRNVPTSTEIEIQTYVPVPKWAFEYLLYKKQFIM